MGQCQAIVQNTTEKNAQKQHDTRRRFQKDHDFFLIGIELSPIGSI